MPELATKKITVVGLGSMPTLDRALITSGSVLPHADGPFHNARHNIGLNIVRNVTQRLGLPELKMESESLQESVEGSGEMRDQLFIASSRGVIETPKGPVEVTVVYPGRHLNATMENLMPWLEKNNVNPANLVIVADDGTLAPGEFKTDLAAPKTHNGFGPVSEKMCGMVPIMRVGVDAPTITLDWAKKEWDFSDAVTNRGGEYVEQMLTKFAEHRAGNPIIATERFPNSNYGKAYQRALAYWDNLTFSQAQELHNLSEKISLPIIGAPLFLPQYLIEQSIQPAVDKLGTLFETILKLYKSGDINARKLLDNNVPEPVPQYILELYKYAQLSDDPSFVPMGVDNCFDFMITPDGVRIIEGDINGGGRGATYQLAQTMMNQNESGSGDTAYDERRSRLFGQLDNLYTTFTEKKSLPKNERPSLVLLQDERTLQEKGVENATDLAKLDPLVGILSEKYDVVYTTERHLHVEGGLIYAQDEAGKNHHVDMMWHLSTPARKDEQYYKPIAEAITSGISNTLLVNDPAKDLLFLNKAIWPVLRDEKTMKELFDSSFESLLAAQELSTDQIQTVLELERERGLYKALQTSQFGENTVAITRVYDAYTNYQKIIKLTEQIRDIIPFQIQLNQENVDNVADSTGSFFVKSHSLTDYGGRGTAAPSDSKRAAALLVEIKEGKYKGSMMAPISSIHHPLLPEHKVELRVWHSNAPKVKGGQKANTPFGKNYFKDTYLVRVNPPDEEKVRLSNGGGVTTVIVA
ncbi:hypothetical protein COY90_05610 [Candidatus Roizmanbacteria bacterium CG_4_10_14_0_8_um_filter_39_9]|uniref:Uncharacterized protein n=1 Tax=Candidatus Roizmanbacteria bacterium CG_4_10_14_0_8_um_filter_39_9 TaxID=1974829 RepID=A0A2M7QCC5_9BACT|nr:MAG: hypothetical protein COY90_05610 [Candidatus Roizmanbacteria bacterium CG_4_10_14_0_8_um_filter_39_9]